MKEITKTIIGGFVTFAAVAGVWQWGHTAGSTKSDSVVVLIKEDRDLLRTKNNDLAQEVNSLKVQLLTSMNNTPVVSTHKVSDENTDIAVTNNVPVSEELSISTQKTGSFFSGEIEISLIATKLLGSPLRHQVFANVFIPGEEVIHIENADPGSVYTTGEFQILITNTGTYSAGFRVYKKET